MTFYTHAYSLGNRASTKRFLGLGNLYLSNYLIRKKENREERKRDRENEEKIIDVDIDRLVVQVV